MKIYELDTVLAFGKYEGCTIRELVEHHPKYIDWCVINLDHFFIYFEEINEDFPVFKLSELGKQKLIEKYEKWEEQQEARVYDYGPVERRDQAERDTFDALTDGQYGSYDDYQNFDDMDNLRDALGF